MSVWCRWADQSRTSKKYFWGLNQLYASYDSLFKLNLSAILNTLTVSVAFLYDQN